MQAEIDRVTLLWNQPTPRIFVGFELRPVSLLFSNIYILLHFHCYKPLDRTLYSIHLLSSFLPSLLHHWPRPLGRWLPLAVRLQPQYVLFTWRTTTEETAERRNCLRDWRNLGADTGSAGLCCCRLNKMRDQKWKWIVQIKNHTVGRLKSSPEFLFLIIFNLTAAGHETSVWQHCRLQISRGC